MALTVVEARTVWNQADAITGWTGSPTLFTTEPTPKELTASIGYVVSNTSVQGGYATTAVDLSAGVVIYVWALGQGIMDTKANHGITLYVSDGTNSIGYDIAGADLAVFRHNNGQVGWQCMVLDTTNLPSTSTAYAGSEASLDWTTITTIGVGFKTLVKAVGGVENCFIDAIRYGADGVYAHGGTSVAPETFGAIAVEDESNADGKAYGIIHELGVDFYGIQGRLQLGDAAGTNSHYLTDTGITIIFEDRGLGVSRNELAVRSNSTGNTTLSLTGCSFVAAGGGGATLDMDDTDINGATITNCLFKDFDQGVTFSTGHTGSIFNLNGTTYDGCAQIVAGNAWFLACKITNSVSTTGSILMDATANTTRWQTLEFVRGTGTHGIYITTAGTYTFNGFTFEQFGVDGTTTAAVYNNSGGLVTIQITGGGDTPTVRNGTGASTVIQNFATLFVYVRDADDGTNVGAGARVYMVAAAGGPLTEGTVIINEETNASGYVTDAAFNYISDQPVTGWVRKGTTTIFYKQSNISGSITAAGYDQTIFLIPDE